MREELLPVVKKEYADYRRRMDNYRMQVDVYVDLFTSL